jgi:glycosyltransferase involved in cell wall biosynthesis
MKISIIILYYNRRPQLLNTLKSIQSSSLKNDTEVIIIDDASDKKHEIIDLPSLYPDLNFKIYSFKKEEKWWSCPVVPVNKGISMATGDNILLLCAECMLVGDVLKDIQDRIKENDYLVYATFALDKESSEKINYSQLKGMWYQHSIHNNRGFNFCSAMTRKDMLDLGGFDERYGWGVSYGDDDFILRVKRKGMNIIPIDNPLCFHQWHESMQVKPSSNNISDEELYQKVLNEEVGNYKIKNSFL